MKFKNLLVIIAMFGSLILNSCYQDTITAVEKTNIQIGLDYKSTYYNFNFSNIDTMYYNATQNLTYTDGENLYSNSEFKKNLSKLDRIELYQAALWIDSLSNYTRDTLDKFDSVISFIKFKNEIKPFVINKYINPKLANFYSKDEGLYTPIIYSLSDEMNDSLTVRFKSQLPFQLYTFLYNYTGKSKNYNRLDARLAASVRMTIKN